MATITYYLPHVDGMLTMQVAHEFLSSVIAALLLAEAFIVEVK